LASAGFAPSFGEDDFEGEHGEDCFDEADVDFVGLIGSAGCLATVCRTCRITARFRIYF
jgi:hypothetical protein